MSWWIGFSSASAGGADWAPPGGLPLKTPRLWKMLYHRTNRSLTGIGADVNAVIYRIECSGDGFTAGDDVAKIYGAITLYRLTGATAQFGIIIIGRLS
jgi:hypothetical protein